MTASADNGVNYIEDMGDGQVNIANTSSQVDVEDEQIAMAPEPTTTRGTLRQVT